MHEHNAELARDAGATSAEAPARPPVQASAGAGERRDEIIDAARTLYEEKGMSRTSIQDITEKVGVARSLFYHYFPNKDAVTSAVLDTYVADFLEAVRYWDAHRTVGEIDEALSGVVRLLRLCLFENDSFHIALASKENAELYIDFVGRVADRVANFMVNNTVRDYNALHEVRIEHVYETFYVLFVGLASYLRRNPQADDEVLKDLIAQTLHMDR
ncbi:MAG: TetR/AcrR family transcriptional regulator [Eggerthellaceae bacterium]|nr:TetR/AcrR family transcriptional regulator [Eggerthellaceae bacterium]